MVPMTSGGLGDDERAAVVAVFDNNRIASSDVSVAVPVAADEVVFVVKAATFPEAKLTSELVAVLARKVWVTSDGPDWSSDRLRPID
jgi:hypothetical protein